MTGCTQTCGRALGHAMHAASQIDLGKLCTVMQPSVHSGLGSASPGSVPRGLLCSFAGSRGRRGRLGRPRPALDPGRSLQGAAAGLGRRGPRGGSGSQLGSLGLAHQLLSPGGLAGLAEPQVLQESGNVWALCCPPKTSPSCWTGARQPRRQSPCGSHGHSQALRVRQTLRLGELGSHSMRDMAGCRDSSHLHQTRDCRCAGLSQCAG